MKSKLILMCAMVAILLSLCACCSEASVEVSCDDFMEQAAITKEAEVAVDGSLTVTLCSNPASTGFLWSESAQISDPTVLQQTDHKFVAPETTDDEPAPGTPGKEVWTFKALKKGESTVSMEYSQPGEGGTQAAWTFVLTVTVK